MTENFDNRSQVLEMAGRQSEWPKPGLLETSKSWLQPRVEMALRRFGLSGKELAGSTARDLGVLTLAIGGIGMVEAHLLSGEPIFSKFALRYAVENLLPSVIWGSRPAELISLVTTGGTDALKQFSQTSADAAIQLKIAGLYTLRSVLAGFWGISKVMQASGIGREIKASLRQRITEGEEFLTGGVKERVMRLAGTQSDVTSLSLREDGKHMLPFFEDPGLIASLVDKYSNQGKTPFMWHVLSGKYGEASSWQGFRVKPDWYLNTQGNKKLLVIEADASVGEQALALGSESSNDLTLLEVAQAKDSLTKIANKNKQKDRPDQVITVLLVDSQQKIIFGDKSEITVREQVNQLHEADIVIDAKAPLILGIKSWLDSLGIPTENQTLIFDTDNQEYFGTIKKMMESLDWQVVGRGQTGEYRDSPRLVYYATTTDTAHTVKSLISSEQVAPEKCCGLFDKVDGVDKIEEFAKEKGINIPSVCSAQIYNGWFKAVRMFLRMDMPPQEIQSGIDKIFAPVLGKKT